MSTGPSKIFTTALEECISEFKNEKDRKGAFFKYYIELLAQLKSASPATDSTEQSRMYGERFQAYIQELDSKQKHESRTRRISDRLYPFVSGISRYTQACDVMVQAGPGGAQLIWGGARIVLQITQSVGYCTEQVIEILEKAGQLLGGYHIYAEAFADSLDMQHILVKSYKTIVCFWYKAAKFLNKCTWATVFKVARDLGTEWQNASEQLEEDRKHAQFYAQGVEARRMRGQEEQEQKLNAEREAQRLAQEAIDRREKSRSEILGWIRGREEDDLGAHRKMEKNLKKRHVSTCEWLFQRPEMKQWAEHKTKEQCAIWYTAGPGAGKTVLCSAIADKLQKTPHESGFLQTATFFFSFNDPKRNKAFTAIRSLALQLFSPLRVVPDAVRQIYERDLERNYGTSITDVETAYEVLDALLASRERIHLIIDGLDECDDHLEFLASLGRLVSKERRGIVKWFLASRRDPAIRKIMQHHSIIEIEAPRASLVSDILSYLKGQLHCSECDRIWAEKSEGNFLWMSLMLSVIQGETSTCAEGLEEELERFPSGLTGCYARSLTRLSNFSEDEQRTARAMFAIIVMALQPLRLSELLHALAACLWKKDDFSERTLPSKGVVEKLAVNLIVFEYPEGVSDDPLVKVLHKSVQDFFLQRPETLELPDPRTKQFFVNREAARITLGHAALRYMKYERYRHPPDIPALLLDKEHAFLKHAAIFWHRYLSESGTPKEIILEVIDFVQSEQFWTCVAVQSRTAPHLFARYTRKGSGYTIGTAGPQMSSDPDSVVYAVALPSCLEQQEHGLQGAQIVETFHKFVCEWHTVLNSYPDAVKMTAMDVGWNKVLPGKANTQSKDVDFVSLAADIREGSSEMVTICVSDVRVKSKVLLACLTEYVPREDKYNKKWKALGPLEKQSLEELPLPSVTSMRFSHSPHFRTGGAEGDYWVVDAGQLSVHNFDRNGVLKSTTSAPEDTPGHWHVLCTRTQEGIEANAKQGLATYHCVRTLPTIDPKRSSRIDSSYGSTIDSESEDSSESDSSGDSDSDSDSALDSESDTASTSSAETQVHSIESKYDEQGTRKHCMLIVRTCAQPLWFFWTSSSKAMDEAPCAFHPRLPIAVWSTTNHELLLVNTEDGTLTKVLLPEPVDVSFYGVSATRKEFHFSTTGNLLHYLLYIAVQTERGIKHTAALSTFRFAVATDGRCELERIHTTQHVSHEAYTHLQHPLVLTYWDESYLYIALPPLGCNAKMLRVTLRNESEAEPEIGSVVHTLVKPVYFPYSATYRNPRIKVLPKSSKSKRQILVLLLDAEKAPCLMENGKCKQHTFSNPPAVMTWELKGERSWRAWDQALDEQDSRVKDNARMYEMLRGSFVMADRKFKVVARSGLDWRRVAYLSCT